jgi:hypothetical protein
MAALLSGFLREYFHSKSSKSSLPQFKNILKQKNQSLQQTEQAHNAVSLFYKLIASYKDNPEINPNTSKISKNTTSYPPPKKSDSAYLQTPFCHPSA